MDKEQGSIQWIQDWIISVLAFISYMETGPAFLKRFLANPLFKHAGDDYGLYGLTPIFVKEHSSKAEHIMDGVLTETEQQVLVEFSAQVKTPVITSAMVLSAYIDWCVRQKRDFRSAIITHSDLMAFYNAYNRGPGAGQPPKEWSDRMSKRITEYAKSNASTWFKTIMEGD